MAINRVVLSRGLRILNFSQKNFSTSTLNCNVWRKRQGLEQNPNSYGPLRFTPDYSFVDGRPVPLSITKQRRLILQKEYCEKIKKLSNELDEELKSYHEAKAREATEREAIIKSKLKPKGIALLKSNTKQPRRDK
ncbi:hypothetical protein RUM44_003038 [Polyplax serrata]|uniref:Large ribosomal subunit protein mL52 n=1 Tax=Polyplax serrata TaxID=468196 RepID=A0ABR1AXC9_POLSC